MGTRITRSERVSPGKYRSRIGTGELYGTVDNGIPASADQGGYGDGKGRVCCDIGWGSDLKNCMGTTAETHQSCYRKR